MRNIVRTLAMGWKAGRIGRFAGGALLAVLLVSIAIACSSNDPSEQVGVTRAPVVLNVSLPLPPRVPAAQLAVAANGSLKLADRARIVSTSPLPAISNAGSLETNIGVEARTGDLYSLASVTLRDRSRVEGTLRTGGTVTLLNGAVITGGRVEHAVLSPPDVVSWSVNFPDTNQGTVNVPPDQSRTLNPGSYAALIVNSRATLRLSSGTYYFTSAAIEPQARLSLTTTNGPIVVYVRNGFNYKGSVIDPAGTARLLVVQLGSPAIVVDAPFIGTLVAPNASLTLASATHTGAFFARNVELRPDARVIHRPFPALPPAACTGTANGTACNDGNACTTVDRCSNGVCVGSSPITCSQPANVCVQAFCDPGSGTCVQSPAEGRACDDGNPATTNDRCAFGTCNPTESAEHCSSSQLYVNRLKSDANFRQRRDDIERGMALYEQARRANPRTALRSGVAIIPVVVHVVYNTPEQNVSDAVIESQIRVLNEDYRRLNADAAMAPDEFAGIVADSRIEFRLARRDPNCMPTNGITRTSTSVVRFPFDANDDVSDIKRTSAGGIDAWPTDRYLNIWVGSVPVNLLGVAPYPGYPPDIDGLVVSWETFGSPAPDATYNLGRTATHELGHWFNLPHSFSDAGLCQGTADTDCATLGDYVCDTPADDEENLGCPATQNTCTDTPTDRNDLNANYMEYVDDRCMVMFSALQATRMAAALDGPRRSLLASNGHIPPPSVTSDLWSQDTPADTAAEPNTLSAEFWTTDDIWVRPDGDGLMNAEHENPVFRPSGPANHVYVRVRNLGCSATENANVKAYWAKASLDLSWPAPWDGSVTVPATMGGALGTQPTGVIPANGFAVLDFAWSPPNPADYASFGGDQSHFCLLSRIETQATAPFGMTTPEGTDLVANVSANNNIVWKNVTVTGETDGREASVSTDGASDGSPTRLVFEEPTFPRNHSSVFTWGSVVVDLGPTLFARWTQGGSQGSNVTPAGGTSVRLTGNGATLSNIALGASELVTLTLRFVPSITSEAPNRGAPQGFLLDLRQFADAAGGSRLVGGQRFSLKTVRPEPVFDPGPF